MTSDTTMLAELGLRAVAIFDDEDPLAAEAEIADEAWLGLVSALEGGDKPLDPARAQELRAVSRAQRADALRGLRSDYPDEVAVAERGVVGRSDLGRWVSFLTERGLRVDQFRDWTSFTDRAASESRYVPEFLGDYGLVLLDYRFNDQGEISSSIAAKLAETAAEAATATSAPVPVLARLTTENIDRDEAETVRFARGIGFPRSAYLSFVKSEVRTTDFSTVFIRRLKKARAGTRLFVLVSALKRSLMQAVETETLRLFELDAGSVRLLNDRALEPAGVSQAEHWVEITAALVFAAVRESADVSTSARGMLELLRTGLERGLPSTLPAFARIENRVRFDYSVNRLLRPIDTGDLFVFEELPGHVVILVTQACDLAIRAGKTPDSSGEPERERVALLVGALQPNVASSRPEEERVTDFRDGADGEFQAIAWQLGSQAMIPRAVLDLVALRDDGKAVIPANISVEGPYWTAAFTRYLHEVVAAAAAAVPTGRGSRAKAIRFIGTSAERPALGSVAEFERRRLAGSRVPYLGIRRIARLRSLETMRLIDHLTYSLGRIALPSSMPTYERKSKVLRLVSNRGRSADLQATVLAVDGKREEVVVNAAEFRAKCEGIRAFGALSTIAAESGPLLDLQDLLKEPDLEASYEIASTNAVLLLRERATEGQPEREAPAEQPEALNGS